jgi:hypothetical protein
MHWALRAWRLFPRFRRSGLFVDWRRQDLRNRSGPRVDSRCRGEFFDHFDHLAEGIDYDEKV